MMSSEPGAHPVPDQRGVDLFTSDPVLQALLGSRCWASAAGQALLAAQGAAVTVNA